jgi:hypothetical protein
MNQMDPIRFHGGAEVTICRSLAAVRPRATPLFRLEPRTMTAFRRGFLLEVLIQAEFGSLLNKNLLLLTGSGSSD